MLKTTIKGLLARKLRLFTTSFAVLIGVAFMAGTLVLTDTIDKTFDDLFATVSEGTDAQVRAEGVLGHRRRDRGLCRGLGGTRPGQASGQDGRAGRHRHHVSTAVEDAVVVT